MITVLITNGRIFREFHILRWDFREIFFLRFLKQRFNNEETINTACANKQQNKMYNLHGITAAGNYCFKEIVHYYKPFKVPYHRVIFDHKPVKIRFEVLPFSITSYVFMLVYTLSLHFLLCFRCITLNNILVIT